MNTPLLTHHLIQATYTSLVIISISGIASLVIGLLLGTLLDQLKHSNGILARATSTLINSIINLGRSVPFIILLIALIPFTRKLIGTSIGTGAAIIPLIVAATPFFARVVEDALSNLPAHVRQTSEALAATRWQSIFFFLWPEAREALIHGATLTLVSLVGYTAMAGTVGGGGLGQLAIDYGYEQFDTRVIVATVILLVIIVQLIQCIGNALAKIQKPKKQRQGFYVLVLVLGGLLIAPQLHARKTHKGASCIRLGTVSGKGAEVLKSAADFAWKHEHTCIKIVAFDDYALPNRALNEGVIDANAFQHVPFLQSDVHAHHYAISAIAKTFLYPLGFYSKKITQLSELKKGALIAIANDPSNASRALQLLAKHRLIQLDKGPKALVNTDDITANPKQLQFKTLNTAQLPRVLSDASLVAVNNDFIAQLGLNAKHALLKETPDVPYTNVLVVRQSERNQARWQPLIRALHSKAFIDATEKTFPGAVPPTKKASATDN